MANEHQRLNKINFPCFWPLCVALLCLIPYHQANGMKCESDDYFDNLISERLGGLNSKRIAGGHKTVGEEWPFIAALLSASGQGNQRERYFCGGTLVSKRHILTAAHCIQDKGASERKKAFEIVVLLGAYNLSVWEKNVIQRNVADIKVHPDWKVNGEDRYDADVAILVLREDVTFTTDIEPISLPVDVVDPSGSLDISGTIVGWGFLESSSQISDIPRQAVIQTYNDSHCGHTFRGIQALKSARSFCAGSEDGSPTKGDSGGGFFVKNGHSFAQYGIVSSITSDDRGNVVKSNVAVYTNVYSFKKWIEETIEESGDVIGASSSITLRCTYQIYELQYECHFHDLDIQTENIAVTCVSGSHYSRKTEEDVENLYFESGKVFFLPYGVGKLFKNLKTIYVKRELGTKQITRRKLEHFWNLEELHFEKNDIELVRYNALWDLPVLKIFRLMYNKITELDERTFEKNVNLREVDLRSNHLRVLPKDLFKYNPLLEKVDLGDNFLMNIQTDFSVLGIKEIYLGNNRCINAYYSDDYGPNNSKRIRTLLALHDHIRNHCQPR